MRAALMLTALPPALLAAACGEKGAAPEPSEGGGAPGEVLGGAVSDEMLPLDTARSTSPVARTAAPGSREEPAPTGGAAPARLPRPETSNGPEPLPAVAPGETPQDGPPPE